MKVIFNKFSVEIDQVDTHILGEYKWSLCNGRPSRRKTISSGVSKIVYLYREIMEVTDPKVKVDHINGDVLDCRRINLRVCTQKQNTQNRRANKNSTSNYIGVHWCKTRNKWISQIKVDGTVHNLGGYSSEEQAARVRDEFSKKHFGEFANLNF